MQKWLFVDLPTKPIEQLADSIQRELKIGKLKNVFRDLYSVPILEDGRDVTPTVMEKVLKPVGRQIALIEYQDLLDSRLVNFDPCKATTEKDAKAWANHQLNFMAVRKTIINTAQLQFLDEVWHPAELVFNTAWKKVVHSQIAKRHWQESGQKFAESLAQLSVDEYHEMEHPSGRRMAMDYVWLRKNIRLDRHKTQKHCFEYVI
jgi:hypothetical protein